MSPDAIDSLCGLLGEETRICDDLAVALRAEQVATVELDPEGILVCIERRELLQEELVRLATERRRLVRALADARTERVVELLPLLPPPSQERVRGGLRRLRHALLATRGLGRQQEVVANGSLENVTELLRALRALVPGARYGADARVATPAAAAADLDRRA